MHPSKEWCENNPDEMVQYTDGREIPTLLTAESYHVHLKGMHSLCSQKWRDEMGDCMLQTIKRLKALPYGDRIFGIFLAGGGTGQRQCPDSYRLRNTMYIVEDDTRTLAENTFYQGRYMVFSEKDTVNILKRDFGRDICEDLQAWWFDQVIGGRRYKFPLLRWRRLLIFLNSTLKKAKQKCFI